MLSLCHLAIAVQTTSKMQRLKQQIIYYNSSQVLSLGFG